MDRKRCTLALIVVFGPQSLQTTCGLGPSPGPRQSKPRHVRQPHAGAAVGAGPQHVRRRDSDRPGREFSRTVGRLPRVRHARAAEQYARAHAQRRRAARPERRCFASIARGGTRCSRTPVHYEFSPPVGPQNEWAGRHGSDGAGPWPDSRQRAISRQPAATLLPLAGVVRPLDADRTQQGHAPRSGIDVYLSNNIALLHGTVRTLSDCVLLAKVLALEPGVRQIDNRLVAFGPTQAMAQDPERRPRSSRRRAAGDRQHRDPSRGRPKHGQDHGHGNEILRWLDLDYQSGHEHRDPHLLAWRRRLYDPAGLSPKLS